ncbi:MAG: arylsulfatase [Hyphomicrobiaceae bacterium]
MSRERLTVSIALTAGIMIGGCLPAAAQDSTAPGNKRPNIVVVMGDDVGMLNIGAYHRGLMAGRTPNIDQLAAGGAIFTDYYAEASCTAGRANFLTGQLPIRTGMTTVGQAGSPIGLPKEAPTIATALKELGYATGHFGKNHVGDLNQFLPCVHGFDEYFGWLYHLDAMQDPFNRTYPKDLKDKVGPRNLVSCKASANDDETEMPRWGKVGKQEIIDEGPLPPRATDGIKYNMETIDDEVLRRTNDFIERAHSDGEPFFIWMNPSRMHVITHLSEKYLDLITPENNWTIQEAGMAQFDDVIGGVMAKLNQLGIADDTIFLVTTDNGPETITWPDGGMSPFRGQKGMSEEGGFRVPLVLRWPNKVPSGTVMNGVISGLDWFPTFWKAAGGKGNIAEALKNGATLNGVEYKVHLDGYDQTAMLTDGKSSARNELWYFTESNLGAARIGDFKYTFLTQPDGWFGAKQSVNWPLITNLRVDPLEKCLNMTDCPPSMMKFFAHEFWRYVFVQKEVAKLGETFVKFPPMQPGASFNLDAVKAEIKKKIEATNPAMGK